MPPVRASVLPSRIAIQRRVTSMSLKELKERIASATSALEAHQSELDDELMALAAGMAAAIETRDESSLRAKLHEFRGLAGTSGPEGAREVAKVFKSFLDACRDQQLSPRWDVAAMHAQTIMALQRTHAPASEAGEHIAGLAEAGRRALAS